MQSGKGSKKRTGGILKAALALGLCLMTFVTAIPAMAEGTKEMPDLNKKGSISITFTSYNETTKKTVPISDGNSVGLYKVADVVVDNGFKFVIDQRFAAAGEIPETDEELNKINLDLAEKLADIAKSYDFDVAPKEMDADGKVSFGGLSVGMYLIVQAKTGKHDDTKYTILPFLMTIPYRNADGSLSYDVDSETKPIAVIKEKPPTPTPPLLPQTGQLWWPVMALGAVGLLFLFAGMVRKKRSS